MQTPPVTLLRVDVSNGENNLFRLEHMDEHLTGSGDH